MFNRTLIELEFAYTKKTKNQNHGHASQYDEETGTPDSTKDSTEMLRGVTYRPPASASATGGASSFRPQPQRQRSVNCLGGCSERKGSSVSKAHPSSLLDRDCVFPRGLRGMAPGRSLLIFHSYLLQRHGVLYSMIHSN